MKAVFVTSSRSDFGLIRPVAKYFFSRDPASVVLMCMGTACGMPDEYLQRGIGAFPVVRISGNSNASHIGTQHDTALLYSELCANVSRWLSETQARMDWMVIPGDRFEILAATVAAYYCNQPIAHLFGGDRSEGGHLDDSVRHAITKLAHVHFPVCDDSYQRILQLGEENWRVHNVGSPVVESIYEVLGESKPSLDGLIDPDAFNLICTYHPITTEPDEAGRQFGAVLDAIDIIGGRLNVSCVFTYPNNEHGSELVVSELQRVAGRKNCKIVESLGWERYLAAVSACDLVLGNSSSAMLEAPILGVPALNIGTRQKGRYSPSSVSHVEAYDPAFIAAAIESILLQRPTEVAHPYGSGDTSQRIYATLTRIGTEMERKTVLQKKITY